MKNKPKIDGHFHPKFASVMEAFTRNFDEELEVGASFSAILEGECVVDLWGGYKDAKLNLPWNRDTLINVYSNTKVITSIGAFLLMERGLLDIDAPVSQYWPEFAQNSKQEIPVRWILSHSAGLPGFDATLGVEALYDWNRITNLLAKQKPWWTPGTQSGYHSITFGFLLGEVIRRITGKSVGSFVRDEIADPLDADFFIGLPESQDHRVAELIPPPPLKSGSIDPNSLSGKALLNPPITPSHAGDRAWRAAEIPSSNGHGNARSLAKIAALISGWGLVDGKKFLSTEVIKQVIQEQFCGRDLVLGIPIRYALGIGLASPDSGYPHPRTIYWGGVGGSWLIMDLDARLSYSYIMNKMVNNSSSDVRSQRLKSALFSSLGLN